MNSKQYTDSAAHDSEEERKRKEKQSWADRGIAGRKQHTLYTTIWFYGFTRTNNVMIPWFMQTIWTKNYESVYEAPTARDLFFSSFLCCAIRFSSFYFLFCFVHCTVFRTFDCIRCRFVESAWNYLFAISYEKIYKGYVCVCVIFPIYCWLAHVSPHSIAIVFFFLFLFCFLCVVNSDYGCGCVVSLWLLEISSWYNSFVRTHIQTTSMVNFYYHLR